MYQRIQNRLTIRKETPPWDLIFNSHHYRPNNLLKLNILTHYIGSEFLKIYNFECN